MHWYLHCRVIDNFGDIGVAWRLAADLADRGESVRLAVDDAAALAWMAPQGAAGVEVVGWDDVSIVAPDVVVELFGAGLPDAAVEQALRGAARAVFVNLEHLSAETYVERSHGLPSPRRTGSGEPFTTWFFYPGFTGASGGLLREPDLAMRRSAFDPEAWLASVGIATRPGEQRVGLFGYGNDAVPALLDALTREPTLLLLAPSAASDQAAAALGPSLTRGALRAQRLPLLTQPGFDALLWSCDLAFVRGEDSPVRAIWSGAPFVWQLYVQDDGAHGAKLEAFLDRFLADAEPRLADAVRSLFRRWNGRSSDPAALLTLPPRAAWAALCARRRDALAAQADLVSQLIGFVESKR